MGILEWLGLRDDSKRLDNLDQAQDSEVVPQASEVALQDIATTPPEIIKVPYDEALLLNSILSANATQQHYINEMLTRAIGELLIRPGDTVLERRF